MTTELLWIVGAIVGALLSIGLSVFAIVAIWKGWAFDEAAGDPDTPARPPPPLAPPEVPYDERALDEDERKVG